MCTYKYLHIVRHGKSMEDYGNMPDIDRPLKERGIIDGYNMAKRLLQVENLPDKIISSPAIRALHTASIFTRTFKMLISNIEINESVYLASEMMMLKIIRQTDDRFNSLMLVGHNPTFTDLANYFLKEKHDNLPTTGIVSLKFETETWSNINQLKPTESFFDFPNNITKL